MPNVNQSIGTVEGWGTAAMETPYMKSGIRVPSKMNAVRCGGMENFIV
jgi:hypothetical protein